MKDDDLRKLIAEVMSEKDLHDKAHRKEKEELRDKIAQLENEKKELENEKKRELENKKKRVNIDKKVHKRHALKYKQEKAILEKFTEKELDLFLKENKERAGDYKAGYISLTINIYELGLIKKLKFMKGTQYTPLVFSLIKQYIEKYNEENKEK